MPNIHSSTFTVAKAKRREQYGFPLAHLNDLEASEEVEKVLIGGDFNTDKDIDIDYLVNLHQEEGFLWASETIGPTYQTLSGLFSYRLDHFFTRGFDLLEAGKSAETRASDHVPLWIKLRF